MAEQGGGAVGRQQGSSSLTSTRGPAGAVSGESQVMEWLSLPDCMDREPSFLQGNSEVTIDADVTSYVHTDTLDEALEALQDKGLVVLCGPPGSGKTTLGRALLRHYRNKEYKPYVFTSIEDWHRHVGQGRKTIVLMDGMFGHTRVKQERQEYWDHIRTNVVELTARGDCRLVITIYPHVLHELQRLERGTHSPLLDPSVIVHTPQALDTDVKEKMLELHLKDLHLDPVEQHQLVENILQKDMSGAVFPWCCAHMVHHWHSSDDPTAVFTRPAEAYVHLLTTMLCDKTHGETVAAVFALAMRGLGRFLQDSRPIQPHLKELRFHDISEYSLEEHADPLKGSVLAQSGYGFTSRVLYDAVGLALGHSFSLPVLLKVCDVDFFVKYIQKEFHHCSVSVGNDATTGEALLQMVFDYVVQGWPDKICQSALFSVESFLQEFDIFTQKESNRLQSFLFAEDGQHSLTVLYWSAWNCNSYLSQWCLKSMEFVMRQGRIFSHEDHLKTAIAITLLHASSNTTGVDMRWFLKELRHMQFWPSAAGRFKVRLPVPGTFLREETCRKLADLKVWLQSPGLCYLDDPSLPIPATLLSVTVTENAVNVKLPSQHWYLALRLLADREVDETDRDGNTLLHIAADKGNLEAITLAVKSGGNDVRVKILLCYGSSVHDKDYDGRTGLLVACEAGHGNIADLVIDLGADVNVTSHLGSPRTPLYFACYKGLTQTVDLLIKHHAYIDTHSIHTACENGHTETAQCLLQHGADVNAVSKWNETPLHTACENGHTETAQCLLQHGADVNAVSKWNETPLHTSCKNGHTETAQCLLQHGADVNAASMFGTPLHTACRNGHTQTAQCLLQHGADVNAVSKWNETPLHTSCMNGHTETAQCLLQHGADVNAASIFGTPLHTACRNGHPETAQYLLQHGANVKALLQWKGTRLHTACRNGHTETAQCLLQHGANVNSVSEWNGTPLHTSCENGHTETAQYLLQHGADVNAVSERHGTPLHTSCENGHTETAQCLLQHGANVNAVSGRDGTPLHTSCENGHTETAQCLLQHGANVNAVSVWHKTPLHTSCENGHTQTAQCLLQHGADVNTVSEWWGTPLDVARQNPQHCDDLVMLLVQHGPVSRYKSTRTWRTTLIE